MALQHDGARSDTVEHHEIQPKAIDARTDLLRILTVPPAGAHEAVRPTEVQRARAGRNRREKKASPEGKA